MTGELERRIHDARSSLDDLRRREGEDATGTLLEALEVLSTTLGELEKSSAELQRHNEELLDVQEELASERRNYRDLFERAPVAYLTTDRESRILGANEAAAGLLGVASDVLPGRALAMFVPADARSWFRRRLEELGTDGPIQGWDLPVRPRTGPLVVATADVRPVMGSDGEVTALRWVLQDVTLGRVGRQAARLASLLDDLLDLDRFTRGTVTADRRSTQVRSLVEGVVGELDHDDHPLEVTGSDVTCELDTPRVAQIVQNLVLNAITHTPPGTPIRVEVAGDEDGVTITVEDEGPGIPAGVRDDLLLPFVTAISHDGDGGGTGIGLSLVDLFAQLHGGEVRVEDREGGGARFVVELPGPMIGEWEIVTGGPLGVVGEHPPDTSFEQGRTDRLVIRRFRAEDTPTLAAYRSDPAVARYQSWDTPYTEDQARRFIESLAADHPDTAGEWFQFAVVEEATGAHIGDVAAGVDPDDPRLATIGVTLASSSQGRGYAHEALTWLLDYLIVDRGKHRVVADCDVRNRAVVLLLERLGLRREAHHLQSAWWKGEWVDEYVYAILSSEWR